MMRGTVPLALMVVVLGGVVAWEAAVLRGDVVVAPPGASRGIGVAPVAAPAVAAPGTAPYAAMLLARPLFSPSRRPAGDGGSAMAGLPRLTGVLVSDSGRVAVFAGEGSGRGAAVREGGTLGAFTVRGIAPGEVTVEGPDGVRTLRPGFGSVAAVPPPQPAAGPPSAAAIMRDGLPPAPPTPGLTHVPGTPPPPAPPPEERAASLQQLLSSPVGVVGVPGLSGPGTPPAATPLPPPNARP